jgi:hypothetical protein
MEERQEGPQILLYKYYFSSMKLERGGSIFNLDLVDCTIALEGVSLRQFVNPFAPLEHKKLNSPAVG